MSISLTIREIDDFSHASNHFPFQIPSSFFLSNLIHIPSNHYARRSPRSFLFFGDTWWSISQKIEQNKPNPREGEHVVVGTDTIVPGNGISGPLVRRIEHLRASFRRHWIMAAIYCRVIYCENQPAPDNQLPRQSRHWRNVNHIKNPVTSWTISSGSCLFSFFLFFSRLSLLLLADTLCL